MGVDVELAASTGMMKDMGMLAAGELMVVETEDDWFLGTVELTAGGLVVRNGFVGRPTLLAEEDVLRVVPAAEYLDPQPAD